MLTCYASFMAQQLECTLQKMLKTRSVTGALVSEQVSVYATMYMRD